MPLKRLWGPRLEEMECFGDVDIKVPKHLFLIPEIISFVGEFNECFNFCKCHVSGNNLTIVDKLSDRKFIQKK